MKTLFLSFNPDFTLESSANDIVLKYDLLNDIFYEIGSEMTFLIKDDSISDKAKIFFDYKSSSLDNYMALEREIYNQIIEILNKEHLSADVNFNLPDNFIQWLIYNANPVYSGIGKLLQSNMTVSLRWDEIYDEYIKGKIIPLVCKKAQEDQDIKKFTIVDVDNKDSYICKEIINSNPELIFESFNSGWIQCELGIDYQYGYGIGVDNEKAALYYEKAAQQDNNYATNALGWFYQNGIGVEKNIEKAFEWYNKAKDLDYPMGYANVGYCYQNGLGVEPDIKKAEENYKIAAERGIIFAQFNLADIYNKGLLGSPDYENAFKWYKINSEFNNYPFSSFQTGLMLYEGKGTEKNLEEALKYFIRASNLGYIDGYKDANLYCGILIEKGYGNFQDHIKEAHKYYQMSLDNINEKDEQLYNLKETPEQKKERFRIYKEVDEGHIRTTESIPEEAYDSFPIQEANISNRVSVIGSRAFRRCDLLEELNIPNSVETIEKYAFSYCKNLIKVIIPSSLKTLEEGIFIGCKSLKEIIIPEGITYIGASMFDGCENLQDISLPNSLLRIEKLAFKDCKSLKRIHIPDSVILIGPNAFAGCESLSSIDLPSNLDKIEKGTFSKCFSLKEINLSDSIKEIGEYCFEHCESLIEINLPKELKIIEERLFQGCNSIKNIKIHSNIKDIKALAFEACTSLNEITIPETVSEIGEHAFKNCISLRNVHGKTIYQNFTYIDPEEEEERFSYLRIGKKAFAGCTSLSSIQFAQRGIEIYWSAFENCVNLSSFKFNFCGDILPEAFKNCVNLKEFCNNNIPDEEIGFWNISDNAFENCQALTYVVLPSLQYKRSSLNPQYPFKGCDSLGILDLRATKKISYNTYKKLRDFINETIETCPNLKEVIFSNEILFSDNLTFNNLNYLSNKPNLIKIVNTNEINKDKGTIDVSNDDITPNINSLPNNDEEEKRSQEKCEPINPNQINSEEPGTFIEEESIADQINNLKGTASKLMNSFIKKATDSISDISENVSKSDTKEKGKKLFSKFFGKK